MAEAQKKMPVNLGIPKAMLEEDPYGEAIKESRKIALPVPIPSKHQTEAVAREWMRKEIETRHSSRGRVLPRELVSRLENNALKVYEESRETALKMAKELEKGRGSPLSGSEKMEIWRKEYSFAVLREMDAYYRPEAEKRVDARIKNLKQEDRKAVRASLVDWMARDLALNPKESLKAGAVEETLWAVDKLSRTLEEMYGKDLAWIPQNAREELAKRAMEMYRDSRESAGREISMIEKNGGSLSPGQKVRIWGLEYEKIVQEQVKKLSRAQG